MGTVSKRICLGWLAALAWPPLLAQRMVGGGLNYAPRAAVYDVLAVDVEEHTVQLRAADGRTGDVYVGEDIFDLSKLKPGDKIRVDFLVPGERDKSLRAASVWPEK